MTSQPMYIWNHTHCMYDTIGALYDITSTLVDNTPLFVCHGTHSVCDILCILYDVTHTVCMATQALYLTWNPLNLTSLLLYMSSHTLCGRHHTCSVRRHRWHMYAIICHIQDIISTLYDNLYNLLHHMHFIHSITRIIYDISSTLYDVTFTMCVTSHNDAIYGIKHYMFMIYSLDMASGTVVWPNNHCVLSQALCLTLHSMYYWHYTQSTQFLKRSECMSSQPLYVWHYMHYIRHHIQTLWFHTTVVIALHPLHSWHHTSNIWQNTWQYERYICHLTLYI